MEPAQLDILAIILESGLVVKGVLILLILASVFSWAIVFIKRKILSELETQNESFIEIYEGSKDLKEVFDRAQSLPFSPYKSMFENGYQELIKIQKASPEGNSTEFMRTHFQQYGLSMIERALKKGVNESQKQMDKFLSTLASIGSVTPFVGLFGTVWGIIDSFTGLASGGATLDAVAPGIAEALVATAVGLAAAIPAVWFFNYFNNRNSSLHTDMDSFEQEFLNVVERSFL